MEEMQISVPSISTSQVESSTESHKNWNIKNLNITIHSTQLKNLQWIHAVILMTVIPFLGSIVAMVIALDSGISFLEVGLLLGMYILTYCGITVGFHRCFSHRAFQTNNFCRVILGILGSMSSQGPLIYWVSTHRRHHQYSDVPGDPHSPYLHAGRSLGSLEGLWHSHMGWTFRHEITNTLSFGKDLLRDPAILKVNQLYYVWVLLGLVIPAAIEGLVTWTWMGAFQGFLWGGMVRLFLVHHSSWTIGSIAHIYGKSPFKTNDSSKNNIWLAIPTLGDSWHNNHHAFPSSAFHGLEWWQIDLSGWVIRGLEKLGLAWDVKILTLKIIEAKKVTEGN